MNFVLKIGGVLCLPGLLLAGCASAPEQTIEKAGRVSLFQVDSTVRPQDDFFGFVNNQWLQETKMPEGRASWSAWDELLENNDRQLEALLNRLMETRAYAEGSDVWKMTTFYRVAKDSLLAEQTGLSPIYRQWQQVDALKNFSELQQYLVNEDQADLNPFFRLANTVGTDGDLFWQIEFPELGMQDVAQYYSYDERSRMSRAAYESFVTSLLARAGFKEPQLRKEVSVILKFETLLARAKAKEGRPSWLTVEEISALAPVINWSRYLADLDIQLDSVHVEDSGKWKEWNHVLSSMPFEDIKIVTRYYCLRQAAPFLNHQVSLLHRQYYQPFESQTGRAHRAIHRTSTAFADVLGKFYLAETMTSEKQEAVSAMVEDIKLSMAANIKEWQMTGGDSVKQILLERLKGMPVEILAPPTWQSYRDLMLHDLDEPVSMFAFEKEVRRFVRRRELVRTESIQAGVPVQSPGVFVVNEKKVLITPAFLQAPFYWGNDETAANYGAAGTWIARVLLQELRGSVALPSTSDRTSRVRTHESAEDAVWKNLDSESVNVAWEALQRTIREDGELDSLEGFSPHQQFFLALAASRRGKSIEQNIKLVEKGKAVQPAPNPINVLLSGSEPFQQVFRTAPGDRMYRAFGVLPDKLANY